jgi:hypothetical protein
VTSETAALGGNPEVLKWAVENGCPWEPQSCREIAEDLRHREILTWMQELGY